MTDRLDLDARVSRFLGEQAPARAPERLIDRTRERVATTPQRRPMIGLGRQWSVVPSAWAGAAAAAIAVVLVGGLLVLNNRIGGPAGSHLPASSTASVSPAPSASNAPSLSPTPCPTGAGSCLGALSPGVHMSTAFAPTVTYTVPAGWLMTVDNRGELDLQYAAGGQYRYPDGLTFHDALSIFRRPVAESATTRTPMKGIGSKAKALAQWLAGHADLIATTPTRVAVGGASGFRLTLSLPTGTRSAPDHCTTDHGEPRCESLFLSSDPAATYGFGLVGPETAVIYLLDLASGDTVMVVIDDVDGIDQPGLEAAATPIVNSLVFSP